MRILNVDDKPENLYLVEALFRGHGHEVVSAQDGQEALSAAHKTSFDAVVSDLLMPRMDGFQLIRELRHDERFHGIPIIVYTATYTDPRDEALVRSLGADRFLIKPVETEVLLRTVEEAVRDRARGIRLATAPAAESNAETIVLKEYNARLVAKLEKKMLDLEQTNRALQEDITSRKRAEADRDRLAEQLRHAAKMEAIGTLAGGIAHDFNNILTSIICATELGLTDGHRPEIARELFSDILTASTRARDLVGQILAFSRQERVERHALDLGAAVRETVRFLRSTIPAGVTLQFHAPQSLPPVLADGTQIHQIVTNLCTNAWHALGNRTDGEIQLRLEAVEVTPEQAAIQPELCPARYVHLSVSDNGCGIDATTRSRVFEPFFTTKPAGMGTGLGLSVVHGIMRSYDGAITVESEPGRGSTFNLYFPAVAVPEAEPDGARTPVPHGRGQRVLFVDDEPMLVRLGEKLLSRIGYNALAFTNPAQALETLAADGADVLLVDLSMPGCDGLELARRARALRPDLPVVLMTGFSASLDDAQVRAKGLSGLLPKPYNQQSLSRVLEQILGGLTDTGPGPRGTPDCG